MEEGLCCGEGSVLLRRVCVVEEGLCCEEGSMLWRKDCV